MFDNYQPGSPITALSGQHTFQIPTQAPDISRDPRQFFAGQQFDRANDPNAPGHGPIMNALMGVVARHNYRMGGAPIPGSPAPGAPNTQFPLNPGMGGPIQGQQYPAPGTVGTQLGVIGAQPATSPFGLPTY